MFVARKLECLGDFFHTLSAGKDKLDQIRRYHVSFKPKRGAGDTLVKPQIILLPQTLIQGVEYLREARVMVDESPGIISSKNVVCFGLKKC